MDFEQRMKSNLQLVYLEGIELGTKSTVDVALSIMGSMESNWEYFNGLPTQEVLSMVRAAFESKLRQCTEDFLAPAREKVSNANI